VPVATTADTLAAALRLADIGIPVFPVVLATDLGKKPLISDWRNAASTDEQQIRKGSPAQHT